MLKRFFNSSEILIGIIFLLSRLIFINTLPVFFDSAEYMERLKITDFFRSMYAGHIPLHSGYILIFWPIFQVSRIFFLNPYLTSILAQIFLALLGVICFYRIAKLFINKNTALIATFIAVFLPLYWVTNETFMMETTYISFFLLSLYCIALFCITKHRSIIYLIFFVLFFSISFLTHIGVVLWIPLILGLVFYFNKNRVKYSVISLLVALVIGVYGSAIFISVSENTSVVTSAMRLFTSKLAERAQFQFDAISVYRYIRNIVIPLSSSYTIGIVILSIFGIAQAFQEKKQIFYLSTFWIVPMVITNQWWDSLLFGRHSLISGFGMSLLAAYFLYKKPRLTLITFAYLLIVSIPALSLLKQPIPYIEEANAVKNLPYPGLLIESHFARPQVDRMYKGETIFVDEPGWQKSTLEQTIKKNMDSKKPVFVSSQALSEPYGLYSGPYLHPLSLSYKNQYTLLSTLKNFTLKEEKVVMKKDNLVIYKIVSHSKSSYPHIPQMTGNDRRLDFFDPFVQVGLRAKNYLLFFHL